MHLDMMPMAKAFLPGRESYRLNRIAAELNVKEGINFSRIPQVVIGIFRVFTTLYEKGEAEEIEEIIRKETEEPVKVQVEVTGAKYWEGPRDDLVRIYISTVPKVNVYYDLSNHSWICDDKNADKEQIKGDVFKLYEVENITQFIKKVKSKKNP